MFYDFTTTTYGKWILAGEHAVLRGHPALVFPVSEKKLTLDYQANGQPIHADFSGECGDDIHMLFWSVVEHGLTLLNHSLTEMVGHFKLSSNIPIGAGMGASAALCAALSRWFAAQRLIDETNIYSFARELEHLFHGKSSGVDIAGTLATQGICFQNSEQHIIKQLWQPYWYLSHSEQIGITSHCVKKVSELWHTQPEVAQVIDTNMLNATLTALDALNMPTAMGIDLLAQAINKASDCFTQWGLASGKIANHIQLLKDQGAIAAKPTGSGDGGFVLSLWNMPPPNDLRFEFIAMHSNLTS